ncbi:hypothetical protein R3P38DRAFT_2784810 [Favolaschia claudopus]|uniref:Uncharacterized protein n=1 Tax=Favolaschia claudopus TaxID=2862362 RepID=A0AAW0AZ78_9AGAR
MTYLPPEHGQSNRYKVLVTTELRRLNTEGLACGKVRTYVHWLTWDEESFRTQIHKANNRIIPNVLLTLKPKPGRAAHLIQPHSNQRGSSSCASNPTRQCTFSLINFVRDDSYASSLCFTVRFDADVHDRLPIQSDRRACTNVESTTTTRPGDYRHTLLAISPLSESSCLLAEYLIPSPNTCIHPNLALNSSCGGLEVRVEGLEHHFEAYTDPHSDYYMNPRPSSLSRRRLRGGLFHQNQPPVGVAVPNGANESQQEKPTERNVPVVTGTGGPNYAISNGHYIPIRFNNRNYPRIVAPGWYSPWVGAANCSSQQSRPAPSGPAWANYAA